VSRSAPLKCTQTSQSELAKTARQHVRLALMQLIVQTVSLMPSTRLTQAHAIYIAIPAINIYRGAFVCLHVRLAHTQIILMSHAKPVMLSAGHVT